MASIEVSFGAETSIYLTGDQVELTRKLRHSVAQVLADRNLPKQLSGAGNQRYVWGMVEFMSNLLHGVNPKLEISELPDGRVEMFGIDTIVGKDQLPDSRPTEESPVEYAYVFHVPLGTRVIDGIDQGYHSVVIDGKCHSSITIDPTVILTSVA